MACRLFGTKPLPELMLVYCQLDSCKNFLVQFVSEFYHFIQEDKLENVWQNGSHFVHEEMS